MVYFICCILSVITLVGIGVFIFSPEAGLSIVNFAFECMLYLLIIVYGPSIALGILIGIMKAK